jgi:hypothetical protein
MATHVADELGAYLATLGHGTMGTTIFVDGLPSSPDACVALIEYPGVAPNFTLPATAGVQTEHPRVQVLCRNTTHTLARGKAEDIYRALAKVVNQTLGSTRFLIVAPLQSPGVPVRDGNNRIVFSFNVECEKALS